MDRRDELTDQALDYVLTHGLVGLSLRPLAAALGTSDRMLVYHFGSKARLVAAVLDQAQRRLAASIDLSPSTPADISELIARLWSTLKLPASAQVTRLYLETCVLAVQDPVRWGQAPERLRGHWRAPLIAGLVELGVSPHRAEALTDLILDTFDGLALHRLSTGTPAVVDAAAAAFGAVLTAALAQGPDPSNDQASDVENLVP